MARCVATAAVLISMVPVLNRVSNCSFEYKVHCPDYIWGVEAQQMALGNETIYVPVGSDQAGYDMFPSTPYGRRLELIELRGDTLSEGFRMKEAYRNAYVSTYGQIYEENIFEAE